MKRTYPVDVLWCSNQGGDGWSFPGNVRRQLERDTAGKSVLHLFGGRATFGTRLDVDPLTRPDVLGDAWLAPFGRQSFDVVILDPPYRRIDCQERFSLFRAAAYVARERVIWFSTVWVDGAVGLKTERAWLVKVSNNCYVRCLIYFRVAKVPVWSWFCSRGPGIRYNRWIAQPAGLPLSGSI